MNDIIKSKLNNLPDAPGVYIMRDNLNNIIYVGKAKILKNRVRQYFRKNNNHNNKVLKMVENIYDLNWIVTDSEVEALILECNLIKRHMPKYNILLKDDKTYPFIKVTVSEDYPRILMVRKIDNKKDKYFGPYVSSYSVKKTIDLLRKTYGIRECNADLSKNSIKRECLNYHINQCSSPCMKYISKEDYRKRVSEAILFLEGKSDNIIKKLSSEMEELSRELKFEAAAEVRDRLTHLNDVIRKQIISVPKDFHCDVLGIEKNDRNICVAVMFIRNGKLLGSKNFYFQENSEYEEVIGDVLKQFYENEDRIPKEIIIPTEIKEKELLEKLLESRKKSSVKITYPIKGRKKELVSLACKNAYEGLNQKQQGKYLDAVYEMKKCLKLDKVPERIEVYDISNTSGVDIVGFMTVFENGNPKKSEYRKFKMKYTQEQDDYKCMYEVLYRRLMHYLDDKRLLNLGEDEEKLKFLKLPDLIFVDGGKGHVAISKKAVRDAQVDIPVFGLVKDDKHRTRDITDEQREFGIINNRSVFNLVSKMQDETHNQAVKFHHNLRTKNIIKSELLSIKGVGEKTRKKLFDEFKTIDSIKEKTIPELTKVVNKSMAEIIYNYFHKSL